MLKSPFTSRNPKDFKILIFYQVTYKCLCLNQLEFYSFIKRGISTRSFDCTYYEDIDSLTLGKNTNEEKVENKCT